MLESDRNMVIKRIMEMPEEQIVKVLIFMAGMEAEHTTKKAEKSAKENKCERAS